MQCQWSNMKIFYQYCAGSSQLLFLLLCHKLRQAFFLAAKHRNSLQQGKKSFQTKVCLKKRDRYAYWYFSRLEYQCNIYCQTTCVLHVTNRISHYQEQLQQAYFHNKYCQINLIVVEGFSLFACYYLPQEDVLFLRYQKFMRINHFCFTYYYIQSKY